MCWIVDLSSFVRAPPTTSSRGKWMAKSSNVSFLETLLTLTKHMSLTKDKLMLLLISK